jgi:hypothetical protein
MSKHENCKLAIGPLSPKTAETAPVKAKHFMPEKINFTVPERITNASSTEPYRSLNWNIRAGGEDHLQFRSLGR